MDQKSKLKEWMNTSRHVYNNCIEDIRKLGYDQLKGFTLRDKFVTAESRDKERNPNVKDWELETPKGPRDGAVRDVKKAYKTAFSNLKNGNITKFDIGFRKRKNGFQSIEIPKNAVNIKSNKTIDIFTQSGIGTIKVTGRDHKKLGNPEYYCRIKVDNYGDWYIIIPQKIIQRTRSGHGKCAMDPGIRKFQTIYSETEVKKCTTNYTLLRKLKDRISKIRSQRKLRKDWKRHKNLIDDHQHKLANYLASEYSEIFLPKFESQKLTKNLNRTSNFNILNLQHYKFKERLRSKCSEYGSTLIDCTEEYTSKTCTKCGVLNNKLGSSEVFECPNCQLKIDRDINGARNIFLKCLCC